MRLKTMTAASRGGEQGADYATTLLANFGRLRKQNKILLFLFLCIFAAAQFHAEFHVQQSLGRETTTSLMMVHRGIPEQQQHSVEHHDLVVASSSFNSGRALSSSSSSGTSGSNIVEQSPPPPPKASSHLVVDILSIGSERRLELLTTQQQTFGSHISVRNFFNATEADDDDPYCNSNLTPEDTYKISQFCKQRIWDQETHRLMRFLKNCYANIGWLKKKNNPVGWMCAQRRPLHGLYKVFETYRRQSPGGGETLPDYLIIMDDDTYFNMEQFQQLVIPQQQQQQQPAVFAGCLVRVPVMTLNFTFGFGGYGTIFNRGSLERLLEPIHCDDAAGAIINDDACAQLERNLIGEQKLFQSGMNVLQLIKAFVNYQPYKDYANWTDGYCMHSDWVLGFFVNHYNISSHVSDDDTFYRNVPQARMEEWHGSVIYRKPEGFCQNDNVDKCQPGSVTCHYMTADAMINYTNIVKAKAPFGQFRDYQYHHHGLESSL